MPSWSGVDAYEEALERLAFDDPRGKKKRPKTPAKQVAPPPPPPPPSVGKAPKAKVTRKAPLPETAGISRFAVKRKIDAAVERQLTSGELLAWARHTLQQLQVGTAAEVGQREVLEEALQEIVEIAHPGQKLTAEAAQDVLALLEG